MSFKVVITYSGGNRKELDDIFQTESEAEEFGLQQVSNFNACDKVPHLSDPGD